MGCGVSSEEPLELGKHIRLVITHYQVIMNDIFYSNYLMYSMFFELFSKVSISYEFF